MSGKRRRPRSPDTSRKTARVKTALSDFVEDDDDLASILEKIKGQEDSEALALRLQHEFEVPDAENVAGYSKSGDREPSVGIGSCTYEDDEAMARRLAREWEELDTAGTMAISSNDDNAESLQTQTPQSSGSFSSTPASTAPIDPKTDLLRYRDVFIRPRGCTKCGKAVTSPRNMVVFSATIPPPSLLALLHAVCDACSQSHCRGCFRPVACPKNCKGKNCDTANCCAEVRAIGLFEALGGFDRQYLGERLSFSNNNTTNHRRKVATVGPGGTGYSTESHISYANGSSRRGADHTPLEDQRAAEASKTVAARWDDVVLRALETITCLLPSPYSDIAAPYDFLPHPSIRSLISVSYLPELLGGLLINDSVTDWTDRSGVYNAMLGLLRRMADSELSVGVLIDERWEKRKSGGLEDWMWGDGPLEWETRPGTKDIVRAPPLYDHFKKLTKQCETFLAGASHLLEDGENGEVDDTAIRATSLCGDMISAQEDIRRAISVITRGKPIVKGSSAKEKGKNRDPNVDVEKRYCAACEDLAFKHATLSTDSSTGGLAYRAFHYATEVEQTANSARQPAKRLRLIKELSITATSLPPGVWIRVDEVRNDVIKIMIAGPEGTPYAGGLFEFDCFLPLEYPNISPKVNLCTTAGGRVRFNPNLYANGKVCLSLLGTWPGRPEEQWSSKSTLLQVLVSIQSMILTDTPFFNEPGYGQAQAMDARSVAYNKNIAIQTVRWAMIDWMKEEHRHGIWADVITSHFSIRQHKIRECIRKWAKSDPRFRSYQVSSTSTAGTPLLSEQPYAHTLVRDTPHAPIATAPQGQNLLEEFDRGCVLVDGWAGIR